jgi:hypothetical protein
MQYHISFRIYVASTLKKEYEAAEIHIAENYAFKYVTNLCNYSFKIYEV